LSEAEQPLTDGATPALSHQAVQKPIKRITAPVAPLFFNPAIFLQPSQTLRINRPHWPCGLKSAARHPAHHWKVIPGPENYRISESPAWSRGRWPALPPPH